MNHASAVVNLIRLIYMVGSGTAVIFCLSGHILSYGLRSEMPISNVNHAMRGPVNSHTKITL